MSGKPAIERMRRVYRALFYQTANMAARIFFRAFIRVRISGKEHLPERGPFLLVCNHISHFDPPLVAGALWRKVGWIVALDMYSNFFGRLFFNGIDAVPVDRSKADLSAAREVLRRFKMGQPVGLYPEAGIRAGDKSILGGQPVDPSVGTLSQLGNVRVVPCVILGSDKLYARRSWFWNVSVYIRFGQSIELTSRLNSDSATIRERMTMAVGESMRQLAEELREEYQLQPDDFPMTAQERWAK